MKLLIVVAFLGVALATPPLYNLQDLQDLIPDDSLDSTNYINPDPMAGGIVSNDLESSALVDNYFKEKAHNHSDVPRDEENAVGVDPLNEPEPIISEDNLREEDDADKVLLANSEDEILDKDTAPSPSYDTNGDDTRQYDVIQIADVPFENIPDEKSVDQLHVVDLDENNDDSIHIAGIMQIAPSELDVIKIVDIPFENIPDEKSVDQLHVVDLDENNDDSLHFAGIMQIAPSELDSLRVEFDDDMGRDLLNNQDEAPQLPRHIFSDPNLR